MPFIKPFKLHSINPGNVTDLISLLPQINKTWTDRGIKPKVSIVVRVVKVVVHIVLNNVFSNITPSQELVQCPLWKGELTAIECRYLYTFFFNEIGIPTLIDLKNNAT